MPTDRPWWAKSIWMTGPLAIIAVLLIASMVGLTPINIMRRNGPDMGPDPVHADMLNSLTDLVRIQRELVRVEKEASVTIRRICSNTAKSDSAREECWR